MSKLDELLAEQERKRRMKLLPFPWIFATRKLARRLAEHIESLDRIIARQQDENLQLRSELNQYRAAGKDGPA
jgi:predicted RNase H-like nuclease (RuvC/YqgF family)